ncbi:MAG: lysylphosphatidylglycerol synthase transmembrane domain-containing protein [Planctomycetota bacterium]
MSEAQQPAASSSHSPSPNEPGAHAQPSPRRWGGWFGWILTIVLLVGMAWAVPIGEVWRTLRSADLGLVLVACLPVFVNLLLRGPRWALLFRPHHLVCGRAVLAPALIGLALNAVLPGRIGEFARIGIAARGLGTSIGFTTSTVIAERVLDATVLLGFIGGALLFLPTAAPGTTVAFAGFTLDAATVSVNARRLGAIALTTLVALVAASRYGGTIAGWLRFVPGVSDNAVSAARRFAQELGRGATSLLRPRTLAVVVPLTIVMWGALTGANWIVAHAVDGVTLSWSQALVVTALAIAGSALPSAPGAWGTYEAGGLLGLALVQVAPDSPAAIAFVVTSHIVSYVPVLVCGFIASWRTKAQRADQEAKP